MHGQRNLKIRNTLIFTIPLISNSQTTKQNVIFLYT